MAELLRKPNAHKRTAEEKHCKMQDISQVYVEIAQVCQPFYSPPICIANHIPPRLEDGLAANKHQGANPQDSMAACCSKISQLF